MTSMTSCESQEHYNYLCEQEEYENQEAWYFQQQLQFAKENSNTISDQTLNQKNYLDQISPIKEEALFYKKQAEHITVVTDELTHRQSADLRKKITSFLTGSEKKRKDLTKPILDFKKQIDELAKDSLKPALETKERLTQLIINYEELLEKKRQEELARINKIRKVFLDGMKRLKPTPKENKEMIDNVKEYFHDLKKQDQQNPEILQSCQTLLNAIGEKIKTQEAEIQAKIDKEKLAKLNKENDLEKIRLEKEKMDLEKKAKEQKEEALRLHNIALQKEIEEIRKQAEIQAKTVKVKTGLKERITFEIINPLEVPKEFCSPDEKLIRQAIKEGKTEIIGVRIFKIKS